ncbi:MAG: alanine racemase [Brevinematia bacterium]
MSNIGDSRKTYAEINLNTLYNNYLELIKLNNRKPIIPVIKADGYGHGALEVYKFLYGKGINKFAVATIEEALELCNLPFSKNTEILIFCPYPYKILKELTQEYNNLIPIVSDIQTLEEIIKSKTSMKIGIEIDTGMGRLGITYRQKEKLIEILSNAQNINISDIMSHFPSSDFDREFSIYQIEIFDDILESIKKLFPNVKTHFSNSGGVINIPEASKYDFARCGLSIYGYYPNLNLKNKVKLKNSLALKSQVILKKFLKKGDSISYNRTYFMKEDGYIGIIPCGYADGIPTLYSNNMEVIIRNKRFPIVGRITMDYIIVKINNEINTGDEVLIFGEDENNSIKIEEFAQKANLIPYEITCGISKRIKRIYKK